LRFLGQLIRQRYQLILELLQIAIVGSIRFLDLGAQLSYFLLASLDKPLQLILRHLEVDLGVFALLLSQLELLPQLTEPSLIFRITHQSLSNLILQMRGLLSDLGLMCALLLNQLGP
jgi:hypothetical protein